MSTALKNNRSEAVDPTPANAAPYPVPGRVTRAGDVSLLSALTFSLGLHIVPAAISVGVHYLYAPHPKPPSGEVLVYSVSLESLPAETTALRAQTLQPPSPQRLLTEQHQRLKRSPSALAQRTDLESKPRAPIPHTVQANNPNSLEPSTSPDVKSTTFASSARAGTSSSTHAHISYQRLIASLLSRSKQYPERARRRRESGTGTIRLQLDARGTLISFSIVSSTGSEILDRELLELVKRASPFPPFPPELNATTLTLTAPVSFRLQP